ncbi:branched-chain amino acid transport system II carrier protein [Aerococcaceae bacterium zg-ZUI334]|uniref:branched-chain amino acid transport system II carrier protein n=1 Tax=Aerococcaceae bacterium zg-252 TaxID=2796928 RepID=UPI001B967CBF|nr:branched-chain amino acid transport system II carrier protein [Aerococcaceae bacterium zg-ZUI334]
MLTKRQFFAVALMAFGIFFGAGNLIFPPAVAQLAGSNIWHAWFGFLMTAVVLPVLSIVTVVKTNGLLNLGKKVDTVFAYILTIGILIAIGPGLAIPRTGSTSFAMAVQPYLNESHHTISLLLYTIVFFGLVAAVSWSPNKIVHRIGQITTPSLLLAIAVMFFITIFGQPTATLEPTVEYQAKPFITGFLAGYNTLDTLAGLNYGLLIATVLRSYQLSDEKVTKTATKAGLVAGLVLAIVYFALTIIGQAGADQVASGSNGAAILLAASHKTMGLFGSITLGLIFVLACFNTCVGLITSISQFFNQIIPAISYHGFVIILTIWSLVLANIGLDGILAYSVPILLLLYPIAITLVILSLTEHRLHHTKLTYKVIAYTVSFISVISALKSINISIPLITNLVHSLPLTAEGLNWLIPVVILLIGFAAYNLNAKRNTI